MGLQAGILLPAPLSAHQRFCLRRWLYGVSSLIEEGSDEQDGWDFWIRDGRPFNVPYRGVERAFYMSFDDMEAEVDDDDAQCIEQCFGWKPHYAFRVGCYGTEIQDHRLLGGLTLYLARSFQGLVDFSGYLTPGGFLVDDRLARSSLRRLGGRLCEVSGGYRYHVSDVVFLRAWMRHPDFYMI